MFFTRALVDVEKKFSYVPPKNSDVINDMDIKTFLPPQKWALSVLPGISSRELMGFSLGTAIKNEKNVLWNSISNDCFEFY